MGEKWFSHTYILALYSEGQGHGVTCHLSLYFNTINAIFKKKKKKKQKTEKQRGGKKGWFSKKKKYSLDKGGSGKGINL